MQFHILLIFYHINLTAKAIAFLRQSRWNIQQSISGRQRGIGCHCTKRKHPLSFPLGEKKWHSNLKRSYPFPIQCSIKLFSCGHNCKSKVHQKVSDFEKNIFYQNQFKKIMLLFLYRFRFCQIPITYCTRFFTVHMVWEISNNYHNGNFWKKNS